MNMTEKREKEKRRERLKIFSNKNQWIKKGDLEQTLEEMSAQLREYRRDLQQIRLQESVTEAKVDQLQRKVNEIEASLRQSKQQKPKEDKENNRITNFYERVEVNCEEYSASYREDGMQRENEKSTFHMYA